MRPPRTHADVRVSTAHGADHPLSKDRIAVYNSGLVPIERYQRDSAWIAAAAPESLRIDLGWGAEWMPWTREVVAADPDGRLRFDFEETDQIARLLSQAGTRPYWSYCYVPAAARDAAGDWRTMGEDDSTWIRTVEAYVAGLRHRGVSVGYHEVYNEPDLRDERTGDATFYTGGLEDYLDLYRATATAIRAADPSARVGGPALAVTAAHPDWLEAFCQMVVEENLPLDFLSFHHYGHFGLDATLRTVREAVARHPRLDHVELHLNEYNAFSIDYPRGGLQDTHQLASTFAAEIPRLLAQRDLTRTHWAQFLDSGQGNFSGMVDIDGVPKPIYAAYEFYQRMPVDRVRCEVDGPPGVGAIASADAGGAAAIVWNRHFVDVAVNLSIDLAAPFVTVTTIDADGIGEPVDLPAHQGTIRIPLRAGALALLTSGQPAITSRARRAWGIQVESAAASRGWGDVDEATATFRFGTGSGGTLRLGADLLGGAASQEWTVSARDHSGRPVPAAVFVTQDDGGSRTTTAALGGGTEPPAPLDLVTPPRPPGSTRVLVTVSAAAGTLVTVAPGDSVGQ